MEKTIKLVDENGEIIDKETMRDLEMEQIFQALPDGYKVSVYRERPSYCDGYQGTEYVSKDCPLDLESLRSRYGGRQLRLRVLNHQGQFVTERTIKFPDPPRMEGMIIPHPDEGGQKQDSMQTQLLFKLLENNERAALRTQEILLSRMDAIEQAAMAKNAPAPAREPEPKSPLDQLKETISAIREIRKVQTELGLAKSDENGEQVPDAVTSTLTTLIDKYMDAFVIKQKMEMEQAAKPPAPPPALEERRRNPEMDLSSMDHRELASALRQRFAGLDDDQKKEAMDIFFGKADVEYLDEPDEIVSFPYDKNEEYESLENYDNNSTSALNVGKSGKEVSRSKHGNSVNSSESRPSLLAPEDEELLNGTNGDKS
jgi:hypothetical protein